MSVQVLGCGDSQGDNESFNTSYVSVQGKTWDRVVGFGGFQYILCVGSSGLKLENKNNKLRFQYILCVGSREITK